MSYTPPAYNAVNASWVGASAYTPPAHSAVNASWAPPAPLGRIAAPSPLGAPSLAGSVPVLARAAAPSPLGIPALLGLAVPEAIGRIAVPGPLGAPALLGQAIVAGRMSVASPLGAPAVRGQAVVLARCAVPSPLAAPALAARVLRYEVRLAVRQSGVALSRRVRAYRLADGALLGEADTVAGKCRVPAGLVEGELCYLVPLDMTPGATDYRPLAANRVAAVLADDAAEIPV